MLATNILLLHNRILIQPYFVAQFRNKMSYQKGILKDSLKFKDIYPICHLPIFETRYELQNWNIGLQNFELRIR